MSINRLRNVAVRMRPASPGEETQAPDHNAPERPVSQPAIPRRVVVSRPETDQKRQIWDLEGEASTPAPAPAPTPAAVSQPKPAAQPAPPTPPAAAGGDPVPSRAKTRIIGFHAEDITPGAVRAEATGPAYPAGFLVVIDGPGRGAFFAVTTRVSTIGRGDDQDICLDFGDESISRSGHASVMYDAEQNRFFLGHGNKANAVRRNDMPVLATEEMQHGDDLRIGKTTLRFHAFCGAEFTWDDACDE